MRDDILCFPGTTISCLVANLCRILDSCSTLFFLSSKFLNTSCILIGLQHPYERCFPSSYIPNALFKNSSYGPETAINNPVPFRECYGRTNIADGLGLISLYKISPLVFPRDLSTLVDDYAFRLSMINT